MAQMLSEPRCLDLWAKVRPGDVPLGSPGVSTEEIVRFARLVEAAALENAAQSGWSISSPLSAYATKGAAAAAGADAVRAMLRARARAARKAAMEAPDA
jgi:hypothetical protein